MAAIAMNTRIATAVKFLRNMLCLPNDYRTKDAGWRAIINAAA